jgi:hypothetical protein
VLVGLPAILTEVLRSCSGVCQPTADVYLDIDKNHVLPDPYLHSIYYKYIIS